MKNFVINCGRNLIDISAGIIVVAIIVFGLMCGLNAIWVIPAGLLAFIISYYLLYVLVDIRDNLKEINEKLSKNPNENHEMNNTLLSMNAEEDDDEQNEFTTEEIKPIADIEAIKTKQDEQYNSDKVFNTGVYAISVIAILAIILGLFSTKNITSTEQNIKTSSTHQTTTNQPKQMQKDVKLTLENSPELQAQYKAEIEKTINSGVVKAKKEIDEYYNNADKLYTQIIMNADYTPERYEVFENDTRSIDDSIFGLYVNLMNITEKYTGKKENLATDYYGTIADYIDPYMRKYRVSNINKLTELEKYMSTKGEEIEQRRKGLWNAAYGANQ